MPVSTHRRATLPVIAMVAFLGALLGSSPAWSYRFYRSFDHDSRAPGSDAARRWSEATWGPGDTLVWHVLDDPLWQPHFSGAEELLPSVEESLDTWTRVSSADVRWRVDGILAGTQVGRDDRNTVSAEETEDFAGQARGWSLRRGGGPWERIECDVVLSTDYVERLAGSNDNRLNTLLHEFGHCLGLQHAATTPTIRWDWRWTDSSIWQKDPQMSYGRDIDSSLTEDEVIGASLLRPAQGWQRSTGSISGRVRHESGAARFVSVHVLRNEGGRARPGVQVFTDEDGGFLVEGLAPGEYVVWVHPMFRHDAHTALLSAGAVTDARDLLLPRRHRVRAGQETPAGEFTLLRGRDRR
ncbi:MAG: hypothetical protein F4X99_20255 [Gammaproteobacteria bacterium]|nr:hypothetical protein [Gammaproteobacteria bacterium]